MQCLIVAKALISPYDATRCTHGEVDIITVFGTVVLGSSPGGCTKVKEKALANASAFSFRNDLRHFRPLCKPQACFLLLPRAENGRGGVESTY